MIDLTRRRFLFGLAAVPLVVPVVKHFIVKAPEGLTWEKLVAARDYFARAAYTDEMNRRFTEEVLSRMREHSLLYGNAFMREDGSILHPGRVFLGAPVTNRRT